MQGTYHSHTRRAESWSSTLMDSNRVQRSRSHLNQVSAQSQSSVALMGSFRRLAHNVISATSQTLPSSLCLHPPFTKAFPDLFPSTGPHAQPGCVLGLPPVSPRGAAVAAGQSLASAAALHLDPCTGNGRLFVV